MSIDEYFIMAVLVVVGGLAVAYISTPPEQPYEIRSEMKGTN